MTSDELKRRTKAFGIQVIALVEGLPDTKAGWAVGRQLIRCATSVGANYRAACRAKSKADFIAKIDTVEEEADESLYWLEILDEIKLTKPELVKPLAREANELTAIFTKISISSKKK
ncbi:four helix bundle protein [Arsenicibacter rosenii]|uniref:Four helix bundle protein n=1 Tax=Arsenicibacter rosenii TaxID=1750698 RepID=A0A1S2VMS8_9BACT|nr:four helix bundle protein [Arsenicibacter rosenii]OIN59486.1 hypothetical protein BLX24_11000 [Arsenicibacter rosenii]